MYFHIDSGALVIQYFANAEVFLAIALCLTVGRISTALSYTLSPILMHALRSSTKMNVATAMAITNGVGTMCMLLGVVAAFWVFVIDSRQNAHGTPNQERHIPTTTVETELSIQGEGTLEIDDSDTSHTTIDCESQNNENQNDVGEDINGARIRLCVVSRALKILVQFPGSYYILALLVIPFSYMVTQAFLQPCPNYLQSRFKLDDKAAGHYTSLIMLIPALSGPFLAHGIDKFGKRMHWLVTGNIILLISHILFRVVESEYVVLCVVMLSIGVCLHCSCFVARSVTERHVISID